MNIVEKKFLRQIREKGLTAHGERVLVAVSGGPDSMAMLYLFCSLRALLHCEFAVAHCNFQLRGTDSDADEAFVREQAAMLGLDYYAERFDTLRLAGEWKKSVEESARILRYTFFDQVMQVNGFTKVATGHHVNDNAETILFNLFRGVSLPGLRGIRASHGMVIRPMLLLHKTEIAAYLNEKGIASCTDMSNHTDDYDRNFIRNRVIPLIEKRFEHKLLPSLRRLSEQAGELEEFLERYFDALCERLPGLTLSDDGKLDVKALQQLTVYEQKEIFKRALREIAVAVDGQTLQRLADLLATSPGKMVMVGGHLRVYWRAQSLCFVREAEK